jgi:Skp family chaperone for outer membrane proteins
VLSSRSLRAFTLAAGLLSGYGLPAAAQQNQQWFVPNQPRAVAPARPAPRSAPVPAPSGEAQGIAPGPGLTTEAAPPGSESLPQQQPQIQLPPPPEVPPLPKGPTPPAAIVGVLSVADVMRASTAFQQADKEFVSRRQKLNEDAQKEQVALRDLGQTLANERSKLTPEQIRTREKELQDRIADSRRVFGERNRVIQEASQYVMAQIDRATELVTQQVAISRGINLVLNRAQILGTTSDFDMTPAVVEDLNKVLASVVIPPDGVSPMSMAQQTSTGAAPASAPAGTAPAPAKAPNKPPAANQPAAQQHRP